MVRFLRPKDPAIQTPDDVRALIDVYLVQQVDLNFLGGWEQRMAQVALLANMDEVSDGWIRELWTHAYNTGADRGGFQDSMFVNYLTWEGLTNIGSLGCSQYSVEYMDALADALSRYPAKQWKAQGNIYDDKLYPRFRAALETFANL